VRQHYFLHNLLKVAIDLNEVIGLKGVSVALATAIAVNEALETVVPAEAVLVDQAGVPTS
jgi:hypothetical protein